MSADAWEPCPFCSNKTTDRIDKLKQDIESAKDTMTAREYFVFDEKTRAEIQHLNENLRKEELCARIDGFHNTKFTEDGELMVCITASCSNCRRQWKIDTYLKPTKW
jgi:hypothetical protein